MQKRTCCLSSWSVWDSIMHELRRRHVLEYVRCQRMHEMPGWYVFERVAGEQCECVYYMPRRPLLTKHSQLYDFDLLGLSGEYVFLERCVRGVLGRHGVGRRERGVRVQAGLYR